MASQRGEAGRESDERQPVDGESASQGPSTDSLLGLNALVAELKVLSRGELVFLAAITPAVVALALVGPGGVAGKLACAGIAGILAGMAISLHRRRGRAGG